jgi:hypothetical protein
MIYPERIFKKERSVYLRTLRPAPVLPEADSFRGGKCNDTKTPLKLISYGIRAIQTEGEEFCRSQNTLSSEKGNHPTSRISG